MAWHQIGNKSLFDSVMGYIINTYMHQSASMSLTQNFYMNMKFRRKKSVTCNLNIVSGIKSHTFFSYQWEKFCGAWLTHWGQVAHICISKLTIIGSDNGLSPGQRQAIIWSNAGILLIGPLWTNFSEILIEIHTFPLKKMHLKMSSGKWRPFCLGLNVLIQIAHIGFRFH